MKWISSKHSLPAHNSLVAIYDPFCDEYWIVNFTRDEKGIGHWERLEDYAYNYAEEYDLFWFELPYIIRPPKNRTTNESL